MKPKFKFPTYISLLGLDPSPCWFSSVGAGVARPVPNFYVDHYCRPEKQKPSVLIVEDDDNCLLALKCILGEKGYRVVTAWDGRQAVDIAMSEDLNLVLLDLQLPKLSGLSVIYQIREHSDLENLPIVTMTGLEPETYRKKAIAAGCDGFLPKPVDLDRLDVLLDYFVPLPVSSLGAP